MIFSFLQRNRKLLSKQNFDSTFFVLDIGLFMLCLFCSTKKRELIPNVIIV